MTKNPMQQIKIPMTTVRSGEGTEVKPDVYSLTLQFVNIAMIGLPGKEGWVLIDTGLPQSAAAILEAAASRFGEGMSPRAIILTHGHFDHTGSASELAEQWGVPVYAHELEFPYLTGVTPYPNYDPGVEGGLVSKLSALFPNKPVDLGPFLQPLPEDGSVPGLAGWKWIHTPGHTQGQVSLFRDEDRGLIAGDAFITVRQDKMLDVVLQKEEVAGPPNYATTNWDNARHSVERLAQLAPEYAITGHGRVMHGEKLRSGLRRLADHFSRLALPSRGKYSEL